jgi:hypothetical protein
MKPIANNKTAYYDKVDGDDNYRYIKNPKGIVHVIEGVAG